ncbi:MAG: hypothetical protein RMJ30_03490 [Nitrososphaerota archaeon]|nr:hypothetical protein [Nitrososphaerota archaeon]
MAWIGLATVNVLWGIAALLDPSIALEPGLPHPIVLFAAHTFSGLTMFFRKSRPLALLMTAGITGYYSLLIKPFEPIAEPQTVGIFFIAISMLLSHVEKPTPLNKLVRFARIVLFRAGIAYPFFEWGLDAYRNPVHFISYIRGNNLARTIASPLGLENAVFALFVVEVSLSLFIMTGFARKLAGITAAALLVLFSFVAAYPLALPQNIALITASVLYAREKDHFMRLNLMSVKSS